MRTRPLQLVLLLVAVALAFLNPFRTPEIQKQKKRRGAAAAAAVAGPTVGGVWASQAFLDEHLANALAIVPKVTRAAFVEKPSVQVSSSKDVAGIIREDYDAAFRRMGAQSDAAVVAMSNAFSKRLLGVYDPKKNCIHILPENAVRAAKAAGDEGLTSKEVLRLLLVRMATIAQDRQLYPEWKEALDKAESIDALGAAGAVLQGHAQYVTERVATKAQAREWSLAHKLPDLVTLLIAPGPSAPQSLLLDGEVKFAVLKGHAFMKLLAKKKGTGGVQRHLREPPKDRKPFLDPDGYFGGTKRAPAGKVHDRVITEFAALAKAEAFVAGKGEVDQAAADAMLAPIDEQLTAAIRRGFVAGTVWQAKNADGAIVRVTLIETKHAGSAEGFINIAKSAAEKQGAEVEEGAGRDSGLPGYVARRKVEIDGQEVQRTAQWTYEGRFVLGFSTTSEGASSDEEREVADDAMEAAAELLSKAAKTRDSRRRKRR